MLSNFQRVDLDLDAMSSQFYREKILDIWDGPWSDILWGEGKVFTDFFFGMGAGGGRGVKSQPHQNPDRRCRYIDHGTHDSVVAHYATRFGTVFI